MMRSVYMYQFDIRLPFGFPLKIRKFAKSCDFFGDSFFPGGGVTEIFREAIKFSVTSPPGKMISPEKTAVVIN